MNFTPSSLDCIKLQDSSMLKWGKRLSQQKRKLMQDLYYQKASSANEVYPAGSLPGKRHRTFSFQCAAQCQISMRWRKPSALQLDRRLSAANIKTGSCLIHWLKHPKLDALYNILSRWKTWSQSLKWQVLRSQSAQFLSSPINEKPTELGKSICELEKKTFNIKLIGKFLSF